MSGMAPPRRVRHSPIQMGLPREARWCWGHGTQLYPQGNAPGDFLGRARGDAGTAWAVLPLVLLTNQFRPAQRPAYWAVRSGEWFWGECWRALTRRHEDRKDRKSTRLNSSH